MQHNNWNAGLALCLSYTDTLLDKHLMVFSGEPPPLDPQLPEILQAKLIEAKRKDWLATFTLDVHVGASIAGQGHKIIVTRAVDVLRAMSAAIADIDFDRDEDDVLRLQLQAGSRLVTNPDFVSGSVPNPTWFAVVTVADEDKAPDESGITEVLVAGVLGRSSVAHDRTAPVMSLKTPELNGRFPVQSDLSAVTLPL